MMDLRELARSIIPPSRYGEIRGEVVEAVAKYKQYRYLDVGRMTLLFEDAVTVWFQIEEALYMEGEEGEELIREAVEAYRPIVPRRGEASITLMVNIYDEGELRGLLPKYAGIQNAVSLIFDGREVEARPVFPEDYAEGALPRTIHYLKAPLLEGGPAAIALRHPMASSVVQLSRDAISAIRSSMAAEETDWA